MWVKSPSLLLPSPNISSSLVLTCLNISTLYFTNSLHEALVLVRPLFNCYLSGFLSYTGLTDLPLLGPEINCGYEHSSLLPQSYKLCLLHDLIEYACLCPNILLNLQHKQRVDQWLGAFKPRGCFRAGVR